MLDANKQKILQYIDANQERLIQFLQEIVTIPSDNPPGNCHQIAHFIQRRLCEFGFEDASFLAVSPEEAAAVSQIEGANVIASSTFGDGTGLEIALNAHGDVVPPGLGWTEDPYGGKNVDGKIYGRGAAVSKSDIASYTFAALALRQVARDLNGRVVLAFNFDEETGGMIGPKWLIHNNYIRPDLAIAAGFTHSITNAHNGCLHLEIKTIGKSAHAAVPYTGHDALEAMTAVLLALYDYRRSLSDIHSSVEGIDSPSLVVGLIKGGTNTNVVPDECVIRLDRRIIPEENAEVVEAMIRDVVEQAVKPFPGIKIEIKRILLASNLGPIAKDSRLVRTLATNWSELMGGEPPIEGVPLYTDARHFAEAGVPVVMFGAGPRTLEEANGHRADEHVKIDDLINATKIVACTLYDLLQSGETL
ncbi:ArgE/DapE family deacylase [Alicyclobacillus pomorum]|uniref:ArgE/DapE family deacylase n=1 Tax=Alicyclobacillus pomorum TaxID=204470 RepID=UPI0004268704|nr:ArgE/DapE family deacylase [Alicyclobacillus pomorum]